MAIEKPELPIDVQSLDMFGLPANAPVLNIPDNSAYYRQLEAKLGEIKQMFRETYGYDVGDKARQIHSPS